jgi:hypothetical protein
LTLSLSPLTQLTKADDGVKTTQRESVEMKNDFRMKRNKFERKFLKLLFGVEWKIINDTFNFFVLIYAGIKINMN